MRLLPRIFIIDSNTKCGKKQVAQVYCSHFGGDEGATEAFCKQLARDCDDGQFPVADMKRARDDRLRELPAARAAQGGA